jgi:hypothetical protein
VNIKRDSRERGRER